MSMLLLCKARSRSTKNAWNAWGSVSESDTRQSYTVGGNAKKHDVDVTNAVVGVDYTLRGLGFDLIEIRIPRSGGWALFVGLCCLGTGWVAKQGLTALWKKL